LSSRRFSIDPAARCQGQAGILLTDKTGGGAKPLMSVLTILRIILRMSAEGLI